MKKLILLLLFTMSYVCAQVGIQGNISSSFYSFESPTNNESRLNQYYGFNLKVKPSGNNDLYFKTYAKLIDDGSPQDWHEKIYNAYISWNAPLANANLKIGRQFVYAGVVTGTLDAVAVSLEPADNLDVRLYGGVVAPYTRDLDLTKWDDGNALGGYSSYKINNMIKVNASYFQKQRNSELYWQQAGAALSGKVENVFYIVRYDHNLLSSDYQSILANASYMYKNWTFTGEVSSQKPKVYEDSFFSIFKLREHNQFRLAVAHQFDAFEVGLQAINTLYKESENNQQLIFTLGNNWGVAGVVYQTGFGGENIGLYADVNYQMLSNLRFTLHSSHYRYERQYVQLEEEATSFSAGVNYNPQKSLGVALQLQQSINSYYDSDFRGLLKLFYSFNY